jgi:Domain of Unknown Function with PDB structure (DUF3857)
MRFTAFPIKYALLCVFAITFCFTINAQDAPIKYGKIDIADLQMKTYPKDTSAEAVVLGDVGRAYFEYSEHEGFQVVYERLRRVKILKKSGYNWATVKVPLYISKNNNGKEDLYDLKGITYNLENGQINKEKLEKESIFLDKKDDTHSIKRFTFAKVKEGSIIEYSYKIKSDFYYNFRDWTFQSSIPVAWSEFSVSVPEYFTYRHVQQGYEPMFINKENSGSIAFTIKVASSLGSGAINAGKNGEYTPASFDKINALTKENRWVMKNLPAIREEPFMTTINDYVSKIEFELSSSFFPGGSYKSYANSWESLNARLLENESFGLQLNRSGFLKDMVSVIKTSSKDTLQQIGMAFNLIKKSMTWNDVETFYVESNLKRALEAKTGNVADINMLLVVLLRELGYDANPVILSTRNNGRVLDNYVLLSKFNYVVVQVDIGGKDLLLDATATHTPAGILPVRCLNGQGRLISKNSPRWIDLKSSYKFAETVISSFALDSDGNAKGDMTISHVGYSNTNERRTYYKDGKDKYIEAYKKNNANWKVEKTEIENLDDIAVPFVAKHDLTINDFSNVAGDKIYFNPIMYNAQKENPFKNPDRKFPVDFGALIEETFVATYTIPEGYVVEEIPKGAKVSLPDDGGRFTYFIGVNEEGKISISSKIFLKKATYFAEEYEALRAFYDQIVQKHAEQIVLKKK